MFTRELLPTKLGRHYYRVLASRFSKVSSIEKVSCVIPNLNVIINWVKDHCMDSWMISGRMILQFWVWCSFRVFQINFSVGPWVFGLYVQSSLLLELICQLRVHAKWFVFGVLLYFSLTKRSLKGSYSVYKGGAVSSAPVSSSRPAPITFPICSLNLFFNFTFRFSLGCPCHISFENTF